MRKGEKWIEGDVLEFIKEVLNTIPSYSYVTTLKDCDRIYYKFDDLATMLNLSTHAHCIHRRFTKYPNDIGVVTGLEKYGVMVSGKYAKLILAWWYVDNNSIVLLSKGGSHA